MQIGNTLTTALHNRTFRKLKKICGILPYFGSASCIHERKPMGLNKSPSIWQSYINKILDCLQSRKYCKAIMDIYYCLPQKINHT